MFLFNSGIACNSLLAKICGDLNKPNGQYYLPLTIEAVKEFIVKLPIRKVSGIGNVTEQLLNSLNIFTCGDLWTHRGIIHLLFKPATVSFLLAVSLGIGSSWFNVSDTENQKSISSERTFSSSGTNIEPKLCHSLCVDLERELISKELKAQTVTLKIKTVDFQVKTRAVRLLSATNEADIIFETAWSIYKAYANDIKDLSIRLLGVRLSNFQSSCDDTDDKLINSLPKKQGRIDHLLSKLKTKEVTDKSIPKYECPICCTKFYIYNEVEVHVEKCLSSPSDSSITTETSYNITQPSSSSSRMSDYASRLDNNNSKCDSLSEKQTNSCNNNKRTKSNHSNGKKRQKQSTSGKNRKITDYTTFEISGKSSYVGKL